MLFIWKYKIPQGTEKYSLYVGLYGNVIFEGL